MLQLCDTSFIVQNECSVLLLVSEAAVESGWLLHCLLQQCVCMWESVSEWDGLRTLMHYPN